MSEISKPRREVDRPHMEPKGISAGDQGIYVGSLMGYKKYVLYRVSGGKFEPVLAIDTQEEAENVAALLKSAATIGAKGAMTQTRGTGDV